MITFIQEHHKNGISRREYHAKDEDSAKTFANLFNGSYFKLLDSYYRILI